MTFFSTAELNKANSAKKSKLLVVDDEQDNLDLLYRTFRKDFLVFRADSGFNALKILEREGEMAAIISDQRMPEMNGTEFLSRTVSDFPDTMRIVLTGYTDISDLIEAINSGQVHKYITKPWEPEHLKLVVAQATQTYDVLKQRSEELSRSQAQNALLSAIVEIAQNSQQLSDCVTPLAEAFSKNFGTAIATLQLIEHGNLTDVKATCGNDIRDLTSDPLVQTAIATGKSQFYVKCDQSDQSPENKQQFQTNLAIAITFRKELLGILSMQWSSPDAVNIEDIVAIQQYASKVAIALTCIRHYREQT
jgi:CheY-like chemotaxis protein